MSHWHGAISIWESLVRYLSRSQSWCCHYCDSVCWQQWCRRCRLSHILDQVHCRGRRCLHSWNYDLQSLGRGQCNWELHLRHPRSPRQSLTHSPDVHWHLWAHTELWKENHKHKCHIKQHINLQQLCSVCMWKEKVYQWIFTWGCLYYGAGRALTTFSYRHHGHIVVLSTREIFYGAGWAAGVTVVLSTSVACRNDLEVLSIWVSGPGHDHGSITALWNNIYILWCARS